MTDAGVSAPTFNVRIVSLRFFFGVTCGREEMKRYMQFRRPDVRVIQVLLGHAKLSTTARCTQSQRRRSATP